MRSTAPPDTRTGRHAGDVVVDHGRHQHLFAGLDQLGQPFPAAGRGGGRRPG
ncbi:hypothetical protein AB0K47_30470 [Streptomyces tirandamycinicus]|uniref:hypothetical protein n=1 Tax=Streptomyces tirandamycinicus TaxID=2174846 RepID=UPI003419C65C